jgi:hypothetical protein
VRLTVKKVVACFVPSTPRGGEGRKREGRRVKGGEKGWKKKRRGTGGNHPLHQKFLDPPLCLSTLYFVFNHHPSCIAYVNTVKAHYIVAGIPNEKT